RRRPKLMRGVDRQERAASGGSRADRPGRGDKGSISTLVASTFRTCSKAGDAQVRGRAAVAVFATSSRAFSPEDEAGRRWQRKVLSLGRISSTKSTYLSGRPSGAA